MDSDSLNLKDISTFSSTENEEVRTLYQNDEHENTLEILKEKKQNLNRVSLADMENTGLFRAVEISSFLNYRSVLGPILEIYELQSVPYWDIDLIRKIKDYFILTNSAISFTDIKKEFKTIKTNLSVGSSFVLQHSKGYQFDTSKGLVPFEGSPFQYNLKLNGHTFKHFKYALTTQKDPGEKMMDINSGKITGFVSAYISYQGNRFLKMINIGDFVVNAGMGLIQWQSYANNRTMSVVELVRHNSYIKPYSGLGEFSFHRGASIVFGKKNWRIFLWYSRMKLDANMMQDTILGKWEVGSVITSGYHRTSAEISRSKKLLELQTGCRIENSFNNIKIGINALYYKFSRSFMEIDDLRHFYSFKYDKLSNLSIDYSIRVKNHVLFGETALSGKSSFASVNGWLCTLSAKIDLSFVYKIIPPDFHTFYANTISFQSKPINEKGALFIANYCPDSKNKFSLRLDKYLSFWLGNNDISRTSSSEFRFQWEYVPGKNSSAYLSFIYKDLSGSAIASPQHSLNQAINSNQIKLGAVLSIPKYCKLTMGTSIFKNNIENQGFMFFLSISGKFLKNRVSFRAQNAVFNTDSYTSRLYLFDSDQNHSVTSIPLYNKGIRSSLSISLSILKAMSFNFIWATTTYQDRQTIGSYYDEITGSSKSIFGVGVRLVN